MTLSKEEIEIERQKLDLENRIQDQDFQLGLRSIALEERKHESAGLSAPAATIAGAVLALLSGIVGAAVSGLFGHGTERMRVEGNQAIAEIQQATDIDLRRLEFEAELIFRAIETDDRQEAIRNLRFFVEAGFLSDEGGRISNLEDQELPGPAAASIARAFTSTLRILSEGPGGSSLFCTGVAISPTEVLTASFCDSTQWDDTIPYFGQLSDNTGVHNLRLAQTVGSGQVALLELQSGNPLNSSLDWELVRQPISGEILYSAAWQPGASDPILYVCEVLSVDHDEKTFEHTCQTEPGSAGALLISVTDDAPIGIHVGQNGDLAARFAVSLIDVQDSIGIASAH